MNQSVLPAVNRHNEFLGAVQDSGVNSFHALHLSK